MPLLTDLVKDVKRRFPLEYGKIEDYDSTEGKFLVYIHWMKEQIKIPAGSMSITIPSQSVTDSGGDSVTIPQQVLSAPDSDVLIDRFVDFSKFIGWWVVVTFPKSAPAIAGFLGR